MSSTVRTAGSPSSWNIRMPRLVLAVVAASVAALAILPASASALRTHNTVPITHELVTAGECPGSFSSNQIKEVAADEAEELVYVVCYRNPNRPVIKRFHYDGTPAPFNFSAPYIQGNTILGNPKSPANEWNTHSFQQTIFGIAVDNSSSHPGWLFVAGSCYRCGPVGFGERMVEVFKPSGEWARELDPLEFKEALDVDVDPEGNVYVLNTGGHDALIRKFDKSSLSETERLFPAWVTDFIAVDSNGDAWTGWKHEIFTNTPIARWEHSTFTTNFTNEELITNIFEPEAVVEKEPSPYVSPTRAITTNPEPTDIDVDTTNNYLYVDVGNGIQAYTPGTPEEPAHLTGPIVGAGTLSGSEAFDLTADGRVFATLGRTLYIWGPGDIIPDVRTPAPNVDELGHTTATLHAHIDRSGGAPITGCKIRYGTGANPLSWPGEKACNEVTPYNGATTDVSASLEGLTQGATYNYRFEATNEKGTNYGVTRQFVPPFVLKVHTEGADVQPNGATLHGSFDPDGKETKYFFEYGATTSYGSSTPEAGPVTAAGKFNATATVEQLPSGKVFHYRIVAKNSEGTTRGEDRTFRTASPPDVAGVAATNVAATSATLNARIDPVGYPTTYYFKYGKTTSYENSIPITPEEIGSGNGFVPVSQNISGLQEGVTYHFIVVAHNDWGTTETEDTTFNFSPPTCPNEHVRQQTGSSYLPDCRAYELVSPPEAGSVIFFPTNEISKAFFAEIPGLQAWPNNHGFASNPPRVTYWGGEGALAGVDVPNSTFDMYLATRTPTGWVQSAPELHGSEVLYSGEKDCSETLDFCVDKDAGDLLSGTYPGESAPFLFNAKGKNLGQLPTNVNVIPEGRYFAGTNPFTSFGDWRMSGDYSHFFVSSALVKFTTDGKDGSEFGTTKPPGSAYDNDIAQKTIKVISRTAGGEDIPRTVNSTRNIKFPAVSADGSHVLMQTNASGGFRYYMSINDGPVVDVTKGFAANLVDMTRSGDKVFFTSAQKITEDDTDTNTDLYEWSEATGQVTRISQGNGNGNVTTCSPNYGAFQCSVSIPVTEKQQPIPNPEKVSAHGLDDKIAESSGDVYFYSPELLDPNLPGVKNSPNLYVYRNGAVHLVATLEAGRLLQRLQISQDGSHSAFTTKSRLTGYDNRGKTEMYTYNASTGVVRCASCKPNGLPPTSDVEASQGGRFMSEDGRVFFATKDPLVQQDANGSIADVYEFVDGRPQLISAAIGSRDLAGAGVFFPSVQMGLEGVSRDGVDVYFMTYDTLTPDDENGPFVKLYDARAGGGFDLSYHVAPCEAADECHGDDSSPPPAPAIGTTAHLGGSGNVQTQKHRKHRKRKHHKRKHKSHRGSAQGHSRRSNG